MQVILPGSLHEELGQIATASVSANPDVVMLDVSEALQTRTSPTVRDNDDLNKNRALHSISQLPAQTLASIETLAVTSPEQRLAKQSYPVMQNDNPSIAGPAAELMDRTSPVLAQSPEVHLLRDQERRSGTGLTQPLDGVSLDHNFNQQEANGGLPMHLQSQNLPTEAQGPDIAQSDPDQAGTQSQEATEDSQRHTP